MNLFAQATNAPNSGASNAEDFQPLTRNPQPTQGSLQPGTGPQSTSGQDILSKENTRIVVPVNDRGEQAPTEQQPAAAGGINWFLVVVVAAVIVAALEYFFRRRERRPARATMLVDTSPQEVMTVPEPPASPEPEPKPKKPPAPKKKKTSAAKKKTKSKSKRKKSRK